MLKLNLWITTLAKIFYSFKLYVIIHIMNNKVSISIMLMGLLILLAVFVEQTLYRFLIIFFALFLINIEIENIKK